MSLVTLFQNPKKPFVRKPMLTILQQIKNGLYREQVLQLRAYYEEDRDVPFEIQKRLLPSIAVVGSFSLEKRKVVFQNYSGFMSLDINFLNSKDQGNVCSLLEQDPYVFAFFKNTLGMGLHIIVKVETSVDCHYDMFWAAKNYFEALLGVSRISRVGESLKHRIRFSYDPEAYINYQAKPFPIHQTSQV